MRKLILIAVVSLLATEAHAGGSRSLSLATTDANQPPTEQPAAQVAPVQTATTTPTPQTMAPAAAAPATTAAPPTAAPVASTTETPRPKNRQPSTEARVIRELHRHGIYW